MKVVRIPPTVFGSDRCPEDPEGNRSQSGCRYIPRTRLPGEPRKRVAAGIQKRAEVIAAHSFERRVRRVLDQSFDGHERRIRVVGPVLRTDRRVRDERSSLCEQPVLTDRCARSPAEPLSAVTSDGFAYLVGYVTIGVLPGDDVGCYSGERVGSSKEPTEHRARAGRERSEYSCIRSGYERRNQR